MVAIVTRGAGERVEIHSVYKIVSMIEPKTSVQRWNGIIVIDGKKKTLEKDNGESSGLLHECVRN